MTLGDKLRSMSDEALTEFIATVLSGQRTAIMQQLQAKGIVISIVDVPMLTKAAILKMIQSEIKPEVL